MSTARWNLKEAGYGEHTNSWANLWSDEQKLHKAMHEGKTAYQVEAQENCDNKASIMLRALGVAVSMIFALDYATVVLNVLQEKWSNVS